MTAYCKSLYGGHIDIDTNNIRVDGPCRVYFMNYSDNVNKMSIEWGGLVRISHVRSCSSDFGHTGFVSAFDFN